MQAISGDLPKYAQYSKVDNGTSHKEGMTHKAAMPVLLQEVLSEAVTKRQLVLSAVRRDRDAAKILNDARMKQAEIRCHSVDAKPFWEVSRVIHHPQMPLLRKWHMLA